MCCSFPNEIRNHSSLPEDDAIQQYTIYNKKSFPSLLKYRWDKYCPIGFTIFHVKVFTKNIGIEMTLWS